VKMCDDAAQYLRQANPFTQVPDVAVVLGSGFKSFADQVKVAKEIPFNTIPHFKSPAVLGHGASLLFATVEGRNCIVLTGRTHLYEGYSAHEIVHPIRALARLGIKALILTNASGGLNRELTPGELVI